MVGDINSTDEIHKGRNMGFANKQMRYVSEKGALVGKAVPLVTKDGKSITWTVIGDVKEETIELPGYKHVGVQKFDFGNLLGGGGVLIYLLGRTSIRAKEQ